jgi:hypothetical protein
MKLNLKFESGVAQARSTVPHQAASHQFPMVTTLIGLMALN